MSQIETTLRSGHSAQGTVKLIASTRHLSVVLVRPGGKRHVVGEVETRGARGGHAQAQEDYRRAVKIFEDALINGVPGLDDEA